MIRSGLWLMLRSLGGPSLRLLISTLVMLLKLWPLNDLCQLTPWHCLSSRRWHGLLRDLKVQTVDLTLLPVCVAQTC